MTKRQRQRQLERRQQFQAAHRGSGSQDEGGGAVLNRGPVRAGQPVGRFFRPLRRIGNLVAHGEYLERRLARADEPGEREAAARALQAQIHKVERTARRLGSEN